MSLLQMNMFSQQLRPCLTRPCAKPGVVLNAYSIRPVILPTQPANIKTRFSSCSTKTQNSPSKEKANGLPLFQRQFWTCRSTWRRAGLNTTRCLVGCTIGDFSALWMLQTYFSDLGMGWMMGLSMASGITTSILLETLLLKHGADKLSWGMAAKTATGMSLVSMLAMEAAENAVDYHLTGGIVALDDPAFWGAALVSMSAGFLAPLPYNYARLKRYGKACH
ncbi:hypothetical protein BDV18DRAFT_144659 [Aspergillus unguis]